MTNYNYPNFVHFEKCEDEPIHQIGQIQSFGALLVVDIATSLIIQVSENIDLFLLKNVEEIINTSIKDYLPDFAISFFDNPAEISPILREYREAEWITPSGKEKMHTRVFIDGNSYVIEVEHIASLEEKIRSFEMVNKIIASIQTAKNQAELFQLFTDWISEWLGYDRVMIFKYDKEFNGEVVAESLKNQRIRSFLNHHFPPKDIPKQAREMLSIKKTRLIEDVNGKAIPLYPYIPVSREEPTNLLLSETRNPSEIHLQYLRNMGVTATLTCTIFYKQKVWGLLCCHHVTGERYIYQKIRSLLLSVTNVFSETLQNIITKENNLVFNQKLNYLRAVKEKLLRNFSLVHTFLGKNVEQTLQIFNASGIAIIFNDKYSLGGSVPHLNTIKELTAWISQQNYNKFFHTREFPTLKNESFEEDKNKFAGFLAIEISRIHQEYIIWFRPEIKETFKMIGERYADFDEELSPRATFNSWLREVKGKCEKWNKVDLDVADAIYHDLSPILHFKNTKLKKINEYLKKIIQKLRESQNTLKWLYDSSTNASYFIDKNYNIIAINKKGNEDMFLFNNEQEPLNKNILDYLDKVQKNKFLDNTKKVWQGELINYRESFYDTKKYQHTIDITLFPIYDDLQKIIGIGINTLNITQKLKQNQKILEFGTAIDKVNDLILIIDKTGQIIWANQTFTEFSGYLTEEVCGHNIFKLLISENADKKGINKLKKALNEEEYIKLEMLNINKQKEEYWVNLEIYPVKDIDDEIITFICLQKIIMFEIK
jgi:PAS domain S-box-containing protein